MKEKILTYLKTKMRATMHDICVALNVKNKSDAQVVKKVLNELIDNGKVVHAGDYYGLTENFNTYEGIIEVKEAGYGFVSVEGLDSDIFVPSDYINDSHTGDTVKVVMLPRFNKFGKKDIAFITKKENKKILIAGRLFPALCYISVDRDDKLQSLEAFKRAITLMNDDVTSIGVFPEGTRQTEKVIGEFHEGPFNIAIHAKAPIVVSTLVNTDRVAKNWPLKPTTVRFDIISVIRYEDYQGMTAKALSDMVHTMMEENLRKVRGL